MLLPHRSRRNQSPCPTPLRTVALGLGRDSSRRKAEGGARSAPSAALEEAANSENARAFLVPDATLSASISSKSTPALRATIIIAQTDDPC